MSGCQRCKHAWLAGREVVSASVRRRVFLGPSRTNPELSRCVGCSWICKRARRGDLYKRVAPSDLVRGSNVGMGKKKCEHGRERRYCNVQGLRRQWHLRARAGAQLVQGLRWQCRLRAWAAAHPVQGLRRRRQHLRARAAALQLQGLRRQRPLRARATAQQVQGVRRQWHLRARARALPVQGVWR